MRREQGFAAALLLAAIAEIQWATRFYAGDGTRLHAVLLFLAACGLLLAAAGSFFKQGAWTWQLGLAAAAAGHVAYAFVTLHWSPVRVLAALAAGLGLALAAGGAWLRRIDLARYGLFAAALGAAVWVIHDTLQGDMSFMVGNVFAMVGWGLAAGLVPDRIRE